MRPERADLKYVWDMLDAARTVRDLVEGRTLQDYEDAKWLRLAVERCAEIIGEAARNVSASFQQQYPAVQWKAIIATRHVIAHEYADIQHDKMWRIATVHVAALIPQLEPIIEANPPGAPDGGDPSSEDPGHT